MVLNFFRVLQSPIIINVFYDFFCPTRQWRVFHKLEFGTQRPYQKYNNSPTLVSIHKDGSTWRHQLLDLKFIWRERYRFFKEIVAYIYQKILWLLKAVVETHFPAPLIWRTHCGNMTRPVSLIFHECMNIIWRTSLITSVCSVTINYFLSTVAARLLGRQMSCNEFSARVKFRCLMAYDLIIYLQFTVPDFHTSRNMNSVMQPLRLWNMPNTLESHSVITLNGAIM